MSFGERDPMGNLGPRVERTRTDRVAYISTPDVAELLVRVEDLIADPMWKVITLDRTNDGEYYAFLILGESAL